MQSRRTFFGLLAGAAGLLLGRKQDPVPDLPAPITPFVLSGFHTPSHDTSFLEVPQDVLIYEWVQNIDMAGRVRGNVRRIKIVLPGGHEEFPWVFLGALMLRSEELDWDGSLLTRETVLSWMADQVESFNADGYRYDPWPIWITVHLGSRVRHMMVAAPRAFGAADLRLALPPGIRSVVSKEPPSRFDRGEDAPWRYPRELLA